MFVVRRSWTFFWLHVFLDVILYIVVLALGDELHVVSNIYFVLISFAAFVYLLGRDLWRQSYTYISFVEDGIMLHEGIVQHNSKEIPYDSVEKVEVKQDFLGRMFRFGSISVYSGGDQADIEFKFAHRPLDFKAELAKKI
jgi:membrane protein YdbS with pleckstrin-like domain